MWLGWAGQRSDRGDGGGVQISQGRSLEREVSVAAVDSALAPGLSCPGEKGTGRSQTEKPNVLYGPLRGVASL